MKQNAAVTPCKGVNTMQQACKGLLADIVGKTADKIRESHGFRVLGSWHHMLPTSIWTGSNGELPRQFCCWWGVERFRRGLALLELLQSLSR